MTTTSEPEAPVVPKERSPKDPWSLRKKLFVFGGAFVALIIVISAVSANGGTKSPDTANVQLPTVSAPAQTPVKTAAPTPKQEPAGSSLANAAPVGGVIDVSDAASGMHYSVSFGAVNFDASALVKAENQFNAVPPAGGKFITVPVTITNDADTQVDPGVETFRISFIDPAGASHAAELFLVLPQPLSGSNALYKGTSATGNIAFAVPAGVADGIFVVGGAFVHAK